MPDLASVAERLRAVRKARRRFLRLWQLQEIFVGPAVLDRVAADVDTLQANASADFDGPGHPWSGQPCLEPPSPPAPPGR